MLFSCEARPPGSAATCGCWRWACKRFHRRRCAFLGEDRTGRSTNDAEYARWIASREHPAALGQRLALAAGGSLVAAALAGALAIGRGLELSLLARPHWFYVLVVPAVAGFGLTTSGTSGPSKLFSTLTVTVVLLIILYCFGILYFGAPEILCDMHIYNPHYEVLGFDWEPWHWKQRVAWRWVFAPGALTELSILHVFDPVPNRYDSAGAYCAS
jgi:hypothetical protein